ncbi:MAG: MarR family transcriptional regulator [Gammaproteobacteria bacterium]
MFERCLYFNVNALARKVNAIWDEAFAEFDLSPAHAYLLRLVLENPDITQTRIADELRLEKSTVTRFINVLEDKQLLMRTRTGRETMIKPTLQAKKMKNRLNKKADALYQEMLKTMGKSGLNELVTRMRETGNRLQ